MKKLSYLSLFSIFGATAACAATTPWWLQPTVCRINPTNCYQNMTAGYFIEMGTPESWDKTSNCWGLKMICGDALTTGGVDAVPMERATIARGTGIRSDFDTDELGPTGDCFGARKTAEGGAIASVNGKYVNVWCNGILGMVGEPDEILENGEITYGAQPTCAELAEYGYVAVENGRCYGKYYDTNKYYIECGTALLPTRLIVLNGADYNAPSNGTPTTFAAAEKEFNTMYETSKTQKLKYFSANE